MKDESQTHPLYLVRDINHGGPLLVELFTPDRFKDAEKFKIGYTVCVTDGTFHAFPDGKNGFRITDPKKIEVQASWMYPPSFVLIWSRSFQCLYASSGK